MFCQGRKYATESPVVPDGGRLTSAAMSDLFYILLTDGESPYTDSDRDYKDELRDSFPPHLTGPSLGKIRDMSPATLTVMVRVGKNGEWKPLWDSCGKAAEWMGKPAKEIAMHALGNGSSFHVQSDKLHPRACASMVCGEMPPTSISAVFENRGCMDPCHLVNSCRVIEVRWGTSDEVTQIYSMPHVTRTRAREWLDSDKGRAVLDTRKTTDFVAVLSTFNGVDNALRCNVVHR